MRYFTLWDNSYETFKMIKLPKFGNNYYETFKMMKLPKFGPSILIFESQTEETF